MNTILIFAVAVVAGVTGSPCQPLPPKCVFPSPDSGNGPIKTGLAGELFFNALGNPVNQLGIMGDDMRNSKNPMSQLLGNAFLLASDAGLLVTDSVGGGAVGDTVNYVAKGVRQIGSGLENAGPVGGILAGLLIPSANVVEALGGDELPK